MAAPGEITVTVLESGLIETRARGVITPPVMVRWAENMRVARASTAAPARLLIDAVAVETVVPGCVVVALRSAQQHAGRTAAVAVVTSVPSLAGLARMLSVLTPIRRHGVFGTRAEALAFLQARA